MTSYRGQSRASLDRAKVELVSGDDDRLKYAALELRMAMECLTYDRALAYKDEFPEREYATWQPKKVLQVLLEIDANADACSSLAFGKQPSLGEAPAEMHSLGTETVLNMATLKAHYDALGSYLHVQSLKQQKTCKPVDFTKLRARCDEIVAYLDTVLASPIFNVTMGNFASFPCDCGARVRRRMAFGASDITAKCACGAVYDIEDMQNGEIRSHLQQEEVPCPMEDCEAIQWIPRHMAKAGTWWTCSGCSTRVHIRLGLHIEPPADGAET